MEHSLGRTWSSRLLLVIGAALLAIAASHVYTGMRAQSETPIFAAPSRSQLIGQAAPPPAGTPVGRLDIPRLGLSLTVFEGVSDAVLRKGPGHLPGTACPGLSEPAGNCVIAGHRDSFFRPLRNARRGDLVSLSGPAGLRRYRLVRSRLVGPDDSSVLAPASAAQLTLLTCYPFGFVGAAPYRLLWEGIAIKPGDSQAASGETGRASNE